MKRRNLATQSSMSMRLILALIGCFIVALPGCSKKADPADAYGNFEATELVVSSEASGKLLRFAVEEGMTLAPGQEVGLVDTVQILLKIKQVQSAIAAIDARKPGIAKQIGVIAEQIKSLEREERRFAELLDKRVATEKQVTDINANLAVLREQMKQVETQYGPLAAEIRNLYAQIDIYRDQIARAHIVNPKSGTVLATMAEEGEIAVAGKPLYRIADLEKMYLRAYIPGYMLGRIALGDTVKVGFDSTSALNSSLLGKVTWISPNAEFTPKVIQTKEERVTQVYAVKVAVRNDGRLKIGMPGELSLLSKRAQ